MTLEQREPKDFVASYGCQGAQGASTPLASLKSAVEASTKAIENRCPGAPSEMAEFQRRAIASLEECAIATLRLADALERASCALTIRDSFWERVASLTPRQHRTLDLLLTGQPNKVIAYELGVAESTVKAHVGAVIRKLRVRNRAQVIATIARVERYDGCAFEIDSAVKARSPQERAGGECAAANRLGGLG